MAVLENQRHELFAQGVAAGIEILAAYEQAGYKPHRQAAHRMLTAVDVRGRIAELMAETAKKSQVTAESLIAEIDEVIAGAREDKQRGVLVSALSLKARITGFWAADRANDRASLADMPDDAVSAELDRLRRLRVDSDRATGQTLQ